MRIAVFAVGTHPKSHKSTTFISKNLAALRVRRLEAEWAGRRAIVMLPSSNAVIENRSRPAIIVVPQINPLSPPENLNLGYPHVRFLRKGFGLWSHAY